MNNTLNKILKKTPLSFIIILFLILSLFPLIYLFLTSIKPSGLLLSYPPRFIFKPNFYEYYRLFIKEKYIFYFYNSLFVTLFTMVITTFLGSMGAYSFSKYKFFGNRFLFLTILVTRMYPPITTLIPIYFAMRYLRLVDTRLALIICYVSFQLPLAILILHAFLNKIPNEIQESASIDGCSNISMFFRIVVPLAMPGIVACAILVFVLTWNELLFGLVLTSLKAKTLPVAISTFRESDELLQWGSVSVLGFTTIVPILIFSILMHKYLVRGLMLGAIKE